MNLRVKPAQSGIALIIVMICVAVLATLAAAFAYRMNVENRLIRNANAEANFYALAQSGVDYCKSVLVAAAAEPEENWNGHYVGSTSNGIINTIQAKNYTEILGNGRFTFSISNLESYANINYADEPMLEQAMRLMGVDAGDSGPIIASILDWIDRDKNPHINGTESDYYESLDPPYKAKDGFMDDLSELKLVRGAEVLYDGQGMSAPPPPPPSREQLGFDAPPVRRVRPDELFTTLSTGQININTASEEVLQLIHPAIDPNIAQRIVWCRNGQDTGQPTPFRNPGEAFICAGLNQDIINQIQSRNRATTKGVTFEVHINVEIDGVRRDYVAVLRRNQRDVQVLTFYWKQNDPASHADAG